MRRARMLMLGVLAVAAASCDFQVRVPIVDVNAGFALADVTWFEEEQTLFVFYRVNAEQGLGPDSQIELAWRTDHDEQPFAPVHAFTTVHTHLAVNCGRTSMCGSTSIAVAHRPRDVRVRLRYHKDGEVFLDAPVTFNAIAPGPPHTNRSLIVYGVFDETNQHVQWRARHQFPGVRNEEAQALGLRRYFAVLDAAHGELNVQLDGNPYGYGFARTCPGSLVALGHDALETRDRAILDPQALPVTASTSPVVCGQAIVEDARGTFEVSAIARKNPEVEPAFPALRSPITENLAVGFMLRECNKVISEPHQSLQVQRLLLETSPEICIDDWQAPGFASQLAAKFRLRIDEERAIGRDMILMFSLHHDERSGKLAAVVEQALMQVLPTERDKTSPRVSGAFVFDSFGYTITSAELKRLVLWCPANTNVDDLDQIPGASEYSCPVQPDQPDLRLGPFRFGNLPILPTRAQYTRFLEKYSEAQAGRTRNLRFRAPERTPISENIPVGDFGVATFFNNEIMTAATTDRFSYCAPDDIKAQVAVFRISQVPDPIPLASLPEVHEAFPQPAYGLGLVWDFPYLLRVEYEVVAAGAASAYSLTVPFGIGRIDEAYLGTTLWETGEFPLKDVLTRCKRFCGHPTFDSAGVYNVAVPFSPNYRAECYRPSFKEVGTGGFPSDP